LIGGTVTSSLVVATVLATCPIYFGHAFTFMTDAPAVAWTALALALYLCGLSNDSTRRLFIASFAALAAIWSRQTSFGVVLVPIVVLVRRFWTDGRDFAGWRALLSATTVPVVGMVLAAAGVFETGPAERGYPGLAKRFDAAWLWATLRDGYAAGLLVGYFTLPLLPALAARALEVVPPNPTKGRRGFRAALLVAAMVGPFLAAGGRWYLTNATGYFLQNAHFGPVILSDAYDPGRWGDMGGVAWLVSIWQILTLLSLTNLGLLADAAVRTFLPDRRNRDINGKQPEHEFGLLSVAVVVGLAILLALEVRYDRYYLALLPLLLVWLTRPVTTPLVRQPAVLLLTAGLLVFQLYTAVAFSHDQLAFNEACWKLVERCRADGLTDDQIDGGYAINGWFRSAEDAATRPRPGDSTRWWSSRAQRFLAVGGRSGYIVLDSATWSSWATGGTHSVFTLERAAESPGSP
jgi:hypothetical protein